MVVTIPMLIAVLALTFLVSRLLLRLALFPASPLGRLQAHLGSAAIVVVLDILVKLPISAFMYNSPLLVAACQLVWLWYDAKRGRLPGPA